MSLQTIHARGGLIATLTAIALALTGNVGAEPPQAHASATCADYPNQAAAQRAADTRDADGDGIYCEDLPCPCLKPGQDSAPKPTTTKPGSGCVLTRHIANVTFSRTKYPNIDAHYLAATRKGWPKILVVNRPGASARRDRLLSSWPTKPSYDRDE